MFRFYVHSNEIHIYLFIYQIYQIMPSVLGNEFILCTVDSQLSCKKYYWNPNSWYTLPLKTNCFVHINVQSQLICTFISVDHQNLKGNQCCLEHITAETQLTCKNHCRNTNIYLYTFLLKINWFEQIAVENQLICTYHKIVSKSLYLITALVPKEIRVYLYKIVLLESKYLFKLKHLC